MVGHLVWRSKHGLAYAARRSNVDWDGGLGRSHQLCSIHRDVGRYDDRDDAAVIVFDVTITPDGLQ